MSLILFFFFWWWYKISTVKSSCDKHKDCCPEVKGLNLREEESEEAQFGEGVGGQVFGGAVPAASPLPVPSPEGKASP